jgi:hypothetical protein
MPQKMNDLYFYLAKRDKSGIRILAKFKSTPQIASRHNDISSFQLPQSWNSGLNQIFYEHRMMWEPWIESANSFSELCASLRKRGYTNLPLNDRPEFEQSRSEIVTINGSCLPNKKIMAQKY